MLHSVQTKKFVANMTCIVQYNSYQIHYKEAECLRQTVEPFLYNYGVDIVVHGPL